MWPFTSSSSAESARSKPRVSPLDALACALPLVLIAALLTIYFVDRKFYLTYVLEPLLRESQAVEVATFLFLLCSIPLLLVASARQWRHRHEPGGAMALSVIVLILLATVFFFGEEIDWGDTFFGWTRGEGELSEVYALNLHNNFPIRGPGSLFLMVMFFCLPAAWARRGRWRWGARLMKPGLSRVVPEGPVISAMAVAFAWRFVKHIYVGAVGKDNLGVYGDDGFYWGFIEQINEQKEMLIALALLLYAVYRVRPSLWRAAPPPSDP